LARPRKYNRNIDTNIDTSTTFSQSNQQEQLTEEQVFDVLQFAKEMYNTYPGVYSPDLMNARLKDINMNPLQGTSTQIDEALKNPKNSETQLRGFSEFFDMTDMLYKRSTLYLANLPSWDLSWVFTNVAKSSDYNSPAFKKDERALYDFLDKFDVKAEFRKILRQTVRQEVQYCSFRDDGERYVFQELDANFAKITGRSEHGLLFDWDMRYFLQPGTSLEMHHPIFTEYWNRVFDGKSDTYSPHRQLDQRDGSWVLWTQTSQVDGQWCFKMNNDVATIVPFFAGLFPDLANKPLIRDLQKNKFIVEASKLLIGFIGFNKDNKSGNVSNSFNITTEVAGKFASLIKNAIGENGIKFGVTPFEDIKQYEWDSNGKNIYDDYTKTTLGQSGTNAKLLYNTSDKSNVVESKNSIAIDEQVATYVYPQFERFLDFEINKRLKTYRVKCKLEGTEMPDNRATRLENALSYASVGLILPHKLASAIGLQYHDLERELTYAKATGFADKLIPLLSIYQQSGKDGDKKNGAPKKKESDLTDSGADTAGSGSNED